MKTLNIIRKIFLFPFRVLFFLPYGFLGFLCTDFEREIDRDYFKKEMKEWWN